MSVSLNARSLQSPSIVAPPIINNTTTPNHYQVTGKCDSEFPILITLPDGTTQTEQCHNGEYTADLNTSTWPEGPSTIEVKQQNSGGTEYSVSHSLTKDTINPVLTISTDVPTPYINASVVDSISIAGACSEDGIHVGIFNGLDVIASLTCSGGAYSGTLDLSSLPQGSLNLNAQQADTANNSTTTNFSSTTIDTLAPSGSITFAGLTPSPSNSTSNRTVTFTLPATTSHFKAIASKDTLCITELTDLLASTELSAGSSFTLNIPSDGVYQICAIARDTAGNYQSVPSSSSLLTIDTVSNLTLDTPSVSKYQTGYTISGACDSGDTLVITGADSSLPYSMFCPVSGLYSKSVIFSGADGLKTFTVDSEDSLGNTNTVSQSVTKDTSISVPTITAKHTLDSDPSASFTLSNCTDATYVYITETATIPTLATTGWLGCSTVTDHYAWDLTSGADGLRTVKFFFRDEAGNISPSTIINLNYDSQPPIIQITDVPDPIPSGISYPFSWKITEAAISSTNVVTVAWYNGSTWSTISSPTVGQDGPLAEYLMSLSYNPTTTGAGRKIRVSVTDNSGLITTVESNTFTVIADTTPPTISSPSLTVNGSTTPPATIKSVLNVSFSTQDPETAVTHFCLKTTNSAPTNGSDSCWISLQDLGITPSNSVSVSNYKYLLLPPVSGTYNIYLWVMDRKQNISVQTATPVVGKDYVAINYNPNPMPTVGYVLAANTSAPYSPPLASQTVVNQGQDVFVYWSAADNNTVASIELQGSTDGVNYTTLVTGLNNGINGSCSLNVNFTGCARWASTYADGTVFYLKVLARDNDAQIGVGLSTPFNSPQFRVMAGNLSPGDGGDSRGALFSPTYHATRAVFGMAVMSDGKILVNDDRGLVLVDPVLGITEVILSVTNSGLYSGDGGPVRLAKAMKIHKIAVDFKDNIWVYDNQKIRRINTHVTPWTIESLIGGTNDNVMGTLNNNIILDPRDVKIDPAIMTEYGRPIAVTPSGDIYLPGGEIESLWLYRGSLSNPRLEKIKLTGSGTWQSYNSLTSTWSDTVLNSLNKSIDQYVPAWDPISRITTHLNLSFADVQVGNTNFRAGKYNLDGSLIAPYYTQPYTNTTNCASILPALDGEMYVYNKCSYSYFTLDVKKLNKTNGTYTRVLGADTSGTSVDGSNAVGSPVSIETAFVNRTGDIYFVERGKIRVVKNGKIYTLYGISKDQGDGDLALKSRFNTVFDIAHGPGNNVILQDVGAMRIREVVPGASSNSLVLLAGNGSVEDAADGDSGPSTGLQYGVQRVTQQHLISDPETGDVFRNCAGLKICRLNHSTKTWSHLMDTTGGVNWMDTLTPAAYSTLSMGYSPMINQFAKDSGGTKHLMVGAQTWNGVNYRTAVKVVNLTTTVASTIYGNGEDASTVAGQICPVGTISGNCIAHRYPGFYMQATSQYLPSENAWLVPIFDHYFWPLPPSQPTGSFIRKIKVGAGIEDVTELPGERMTSFIKVSNRLYFCNSLGRFKYQELTGAYPIYELSLPPGMFCTGISMLYKAADSTFPARIVFPIKGHGAMGVMEYNL
ncbi:hypothetical protein [Bdellovibrio sp. HCB209]|uniref:hypothetical protein n=1 Tax=Bdellovibrio sp. HCB209 TaxID=3394354 RepID=UPI0039B3D0BD